MRILLALLCLSAAAGVRAGQQPETARKADWKFSSSVNYDTGKYGTPDRIRSVYIPFTLKRYFADADLSVTVPYLRQSSAGQVTWVGGKPVRVSRGTGAASASEESGLGDIILRGTYALKRDGPKSFGLGLAGRLKLPTADEDKGLGTGELDEGVGFEFSKELDPSWTLLADGYFTIIGDPEGVNFYNQISLDIGFYRMLGNNLGLTVLYESQSAMVEGNSDPRSLSGSLSYRARGGVQFSGGLTLGLSEGSPDIGLSAGFNYKF